MSGPTRTARALTWLAHHDFTLSLVGLAAACLIVFTPTGLPAGLRVALGCASVVMMAAVLAGCIATSWHARQLCPPCAQRFPLNGPELAERRERTLTAFHVLNHSVPMTLVAAGMVVCNWLPWGDWVLLAGFAVLSVAAWTARTHMPLQLWCWRCDWDDDDGGDDDGDDQPPPGPVREAYLLGKENGA